MTIILKVLRKDIQKYVVKKLFLDVDSETKLQKMLDPMHRVKSRCIYSCFSIPKMLPNCNKFTRLSMQLFFMTIATLWYIASYQRYVYTVKVQLCSYLSHLYVHNNILNNELLPYMVIHCKMCDLVGLLSVVYSWWRRMGGPQLC